MLLLIAVAILAAVVFVVGALIQVIRRAQKVNFADVLLIFLAALLPFCALIVSALDGEPEARIETYALYFGGGLALAGLLLTLLEAFRPQRLRGSRGLLALFAGLFVAVTSFTVPITAAYVMLPAEESPAAVATVPETEGVEPTAIPANISEEEAQRLRFESLFTGVFERIFNIIGEETGLDIDAILVALDDGQTVAQLIETREGSLNRVIADISDEMRRVIEIMAAEGVVSRLQAALALSQVERFVTFAVNNDIRTLANLGRSPEEIATAEAASGGDTVRPIFDFLTATFTPEGELVAAAVTDSGPTATSTPTPRPTLTQTPTRTLVPSRTPEPSPTATNTRAPYQSPTPTATATLPNPCVAVMNFNVNMREEPDLEAELVDTIPFETAVSIYGRNEDSTWWFAEYNGQAGWLSGEFILLTSACERLPVREVR